MASRLRTREWAGVDFYAELGLTRFARPTEVDEAFRRLAKELHPDRNPEPGAEDRFKRISAAYGVLRDPVSRAAYDDFRRRVATGALLRDRSVREHRAAPVVVMRPPAHRPMPPWVRRTVAAVLVVLGVVVGAWVLTGDIPGRAGDHAAVAITLWLVALKLLVCGAIVLLYPRLRARWHRPPVRAA